METQQRKHFIGGNWKSNNTRAQTQELVHNILANLKFDNNAADIVVAPPFLQLLEVQELLKGTQVQVAAQNCSTYGFGAYTGEVSVEHLKDSNIPWVILGHSERRTLFGQTDQVVADKIKFVLEKGGVSVIACFGETLQQREANQTNQVCERQLSAIIKTLNNEKSWDNIVLAYEPVWAIGTGKVATVEQVKEVHAHLRKFLQEHLPTAANKLRIIYGGSVTDKNAKELLQVENVDGFLVGGASLKAAFGDIVATTSH